MPHYQSFDPNTEFTGQATLAFIKNINHREIESILKKHHLDTIDPSSWYKVQDILDVMSDISNEDDSSANFVSIGMAAGQLAVDRMTPEQRATTVESWLSAYADSMYDARHRGGGAGKLTLTKESDQHLIIHMNSPYPDDIMYGLFYAFVRALRPPGKGFVLRYDEESPRRDLGGSVTLIHVQIDP